MPMKHVMETELETRNQIYAAELSTRLAIIGDFIAKIKGTRPKPQVILSHDDSQDHDLSGVDVATELAGSDTEDVIEKIYAMFERKDLDKFATIGGTKGFAKFVKSDFKKGVESSSVQGRKDKFGINFIEAKPLMTFWEHVLAALSDQMMIILCIAAVVSLILGLTVPDPHTGKVEYATGWIEGTAILVSVTIVTLVTAVNDHTQALKFEALTKETSKRYVDVLRDGIKTTLMTTELVVGDIVYLHNGDILSADGFYIDGVDLKCDESTVSGESDTCPKGNKKDPFFISGTSLVEGAGRMIVTAVGVNSFDGRLKQSVADAGDSETPLQKKLSGLADDIGFMGGVAAGLTFLVLAVKELYRIFEGDEPFHVKPFLDFLIVAVTIVVVAIPEGLPLAVTIALAYSQESMMKDNCLVRVMAACETMGGATTICSDKTGTLTTNRMTVVQAWIAEKRVIVPGTGIPQPKRTSAAKADCQRCNTNAATLECHTCRNAVFCDGCDAEIHQGVWGNHERAERAIVDYNLLDGLQSDVVDTFVNACSHNSTAELKYDENGLSSWAGNKTEIGILRFLSDNLHKDPRAVRQSVPAGDVRQFPFNSDKKRMTTLVRENGQTTAYVKGAPELLLPLCSGYMTFGGRVVPLTQDKRDYLKAVITDMALLGNRCLLVATADADTLSFPEDEPEYPYTVVAILGIQDPIREEVPDAVRRCQRAGIMVRMVTGDNKQTAISIAEKAGIYSKESDGIAMEGREFARMAEQDPEKLRSMLPHLQVLARSSPKDKFILVQMLQNMGNIVAVTGDGTNDAAALREAKVGFAMKTGTEIAQLASKIVLLDDNFVSVVKACMWGRNVNDNIRKFLQFQVTVNVVGVALTFIGAAFSDANTAPLSPVQLLWLNLIMDTLAALALATEQPTMDLLNMPPKHPDASLISARMWVNIIGHSAFQLVVMLGLLYDGHNWLGLEVNSDKHKCIVFNTFILIQIWNEFNARKLHGEWNIFEHMLERSPFHLAVTAIMVAFQFVAVQFGGKFFNTTPLSLDEWIFCTFIGSLCIPYGRLLSLIPVADDHETEETIIKKADGKFKVAGKEMIHRVKAVKALKDD